MFACKKLEIEYQEEPEKAYPGRWWEQKGRLLIPIDKNDKIPKNEVLQNLSGILRRIVPKKKVVKSKKKKDKDDKMSDKTPPVR